MCICRSTINISGHLPVFCKLREQTQDVIIEICLTFIWKIFSINDISQLDWSLILHPSKTLHAKTLDAIDAIQFIANKHASMKLASRAKQKQMSKPWITKGILKSIKFKQDMYRSHFRIAMTMKKLLCGIQKILQYPISSYLYE